MRPSPRVGTFATARAALEFLLCSLAFAACGGTAFSGGAGDASVGGAVATGGQSGGGAPGAGGNQNVGGMPGGGTGGAPATCTLASDCTICAYNKAPANSSQCYCANCANTPMTASQCAANQSAWQANCANVRLACPAIACILPAPAACSNGLCTASSSATTN